MTVFISPQKSPLPPAITYYFITPQCNVHKNKWNEVMQLKLKQLWYARVGNLISLTFKFL